LAGQLNGTSGYEEAAGQGIVAGINASRWARDDEPVEFLRTNSFIGVMVDDLTTKGVEDPYRMLTARAEHRLLLRHDNADERLTPLSRSVGLCNDERWERFEAKQEVIQRGLFALESNHVSIADEEVFGELGLNASKQKTSLFDLMRRPEIGLLKVEEIAEKMGIDLGIPSEGEARDQIELQALYSGYVVQQKRMAEKAQKMDELRIPNDWDYESVNSLSFESKEKLSRIRPTTVGQASRIPGVRPTDIALLIGYLKGRVGGRA
jgi:tRNA uridine 5-carboxymethylaminomethyl modification enzyme